MKLYTLKECWEQNGKKVPFVVDWYLSENQIFKDLIIYKVDVNQRIIEFYHEPYDFGNLHTNGKLFNEGHLGLFDFKIAEYRRNFENLINSP